MGKKNWRNFGAEKFRRKKENNKNKNIIIETWFKNSWLKEKDNDIREKQSDKAKVADNVLSSLSNVNSISNPNINK